ncbi:MAG: PH domain-containing protein [Lysobacteraceae bacterium]
MTTPSEPGTPDPALPGDSAVLTPASAPDRRLHPLSWLFVLLASLRQFAVPLIVVLVLGRRSDGGPPWELIALVGTLFLVAGAVVQYFTYRFRIERDGLRIRSGLLQRTYRDVPFRRIHNVTVHRSILHRLAGVAEVRLESAGGVKPEAEMRVLRLADALALEALAQQRREAPAVAGGDQAPTQARGPEEAILALPAAELVRLGLISNRGMIVVAAAFGLLMQAGGGEVIGTGITWMTESLTERFGMQDIAAAGTTFLIISGGVFVLLAVLALRLLSIALSMFQFFDFRLSQDHGRIQVDAGLLTRIRRNTPARRIQAFHLEETLLHRFFGRRSLRVDTAVIEAENQPRSLRDLVPVARPATVDAVLARLFPGLDWPDLPWRPLHPRAWRRMFIKPLWALLAVTCVLVWQLGTVALWALLLVPLLAAHARVLARRAAWAVTDGTIALRNGWLSRHWSFAEIGKLQAVEFRQTPFDRRHRMATLSFDTAGANPMGRGLVARYLPEDEARALAVWLNGRIAGQRLNW